MCIRDRYIYNKGKNDAEQNEKTQKNIAKKLMGAVVVEAIRWLMTCLLYTSRCV